MTTEGTTEDVPALHHTEIGEPGTGERVVFLHGLFGQGRNFTQVAKALRLEMLESMPEERQRRRIQVTGIENGVLDPEIPSRDGQSADEGEEDLVISRVKFETLSKRLPVVKGQEEEEKEEKVTADDLRTVLSELKSLRQELAELKSAK